MPSTLMVAGGVLTTFGIVTAVGFAASGAWWLSLAGAILALTGGGLHEIGYRQLARQYRDRSVTRKRP